MDPTLLSTLISVGISIATVLLHKKLVTPPGPAPQKPADPFSGLPGLPGHPVLNVILPWLSSLVSGTPVSAATPADSAQNQAAISAFANLIQSDPGAHHQMQALLNNAPATK